MRVLRTDGESVSSCVYVDEKDFNLTKMFSDSIVYDKGSFIVYFIKYCSLILSVGTLNIDILFQPIYSKKM